MNLFLHTFGPTYYLHHLRSCASRAYGANGGGWGIPAQPQYCAGGHWGQSPSDVVPLTLAAMGLAAAMRQWRTADWLGLLMPVFWS